MIISLDTETTGVDFVHGAMPFIITTCDDENNVLFWEWPVDPLTRRVLVDESDLPDIAELIEVADLIYTQNGKFDVRALAAIGLAFSWHKYRDTLVAGHLLASNHSHTLDAMVDEYLGEKIEHYEVAVKEAVKAARNIAKRHYPEWRIAREGEEDMPSIKGSSKRDEDRPWKADMWLLRALMAAGHDVPEEWATLCSTYANADSSFTLPLGVEMERIIRQRGYWAHYEHKLAVHRTACEMECTGVTVIGEYTETTIENYDRHCSEAEAELCCIASDYGHELDLAKGAALNDNMRDFFYGAEHLVCPRCNYVKRLKHWNGETANGLTHCPKCGKGNTRRASVQQALHLFSQGNLGLPPIESKKTGNATLDESAMQEYLGTLEGPPHDFIKMLLEKRKLGTDLNYMRAYQRFWVPVTTIDGTVVPDYYRIHPSLNPCGTHHLRWSSNSPNLQNVGGKEDKCEECRGEGCDHCDGTGKARMSVKNCFGPASGREWYSMDYKSIEARLPAYESGEPKQIELFEKPDQPPYWGNLYLLTASVLYPDEFWPVAETDGEFRRLYPRLYKKAKFFVLAKNYGAGRKKGDLLSGIRNSYDLVNSEFPLLTALQARILREAERTGWVYTMPTRAIDPSRGYPLLASRTEDNYVLSTTPFNYHISGTACECKNLALVRCAERCRQWREEGFDARLPLEVHDELLFDLPVGPEWDSNLEKALELRALMEQSGEDLVPRIPTPVKVEYHARTWAEGVAV